VVKRNGDQSPKLAAASGCSKGSTRV
jgi:hypothetical protein